MFNNNARLLRYGNAEKLIGRSKILERVQLHVREVTRPSFSRAEIEGCGLRD